MAKKKDDAQKILDEVESKPKKSDDKEIKIKFSWKKLSIALGVLLIISIAFNVSGGGAGLGVSTISTNEAADNVVQFIGENIQGATAEVVSKSMGNGLHKIDLNLKGAQGTQPLTVYVTTDGKLMFPQVVSLTGEATERPTQQPQPAQTPSVPQTAKPVVELFVMSHCPFGTQAEKGILPVAELLGDKIDFDVKFVYYAMHAEKEVVEQTRQVCIQEEQSDKYIDYLWCFLDSDDYAKCLTETKIDTTKLDTCTTKLDEEHAITENLENKELWLKNPQTGQPSFPKFLVHNSENEQYGIRGSPTLVVNGQATSSGRDSASYLATICAAFNEAPEECDEQLSSTSPSSGFGLSGTGAASAATCG